MPGEKSNSCRSSTGICYTSVTSVTSNADKTLSLPGKTRKSQSTQSTFSSTWWWIRPVSFMFCTAAMLCHYFSVDFQGPTVHRASCIINSVGLGSNPAVTDSWIHKLGGIISLQTCPTELLMFCFGKLFGSKNVPTGSVPTDPVWYSLPVFVHFLEWSVASLYAISRTGCDEYSEELCASSSSMCAR